MFKIDMKEFPKIKQKDLSIGCIPANIENILKYYGNYSFTEAQILELYHKRQIESLSFPHFERDFAPFIPDFEIEFKNCQGSIEKLKKYLKSNIKNAIPVLLPIKAKMNPNCTHIISVIGFDDRLFLYYDPGDGKEHKVNYNNTDFENLIQAGDFHTLIIKRK